MRPSRKALFFDFDGVLADTERLYWREWALVMTGHGIELSWQDYCRYGRGFKDREMLRQLPALRARAATVEELIQSIDLVQLRVRETAAEELPISAETIALIRSLSGFRMGVISSSNRIDVEPHLERAGMRHAFDALVTAEDTEQHKPDPAPYLLARKLLGAEGGLAFEDSIAGLASAEAAGLTAVPVSAPEALSEIVQARIAQLSS